MPPLPGEERLLTLFVDVHYYFQRPSNRPLRHRFDKGSYFYIYYNGTRQTSRIEIANNPGTPEQDAVHGYIDKSRVTSSPRFPSRVSVEIEAEDLTQSPTAPVVKDLDEWRVFSGDIRDASREKLKVHTMDLYFWAQDDARLTIDFFGKLLAANQLDTGSSPAAANNNPRAPKQDSVSPVVKHLENAVISDPAYHNDQIPNPSNQTQGIPVKLPPPPPTSQSQRSSQSKSPYQASQSSSRNETRSPTTETDYTPMAYNPAAPSAPEPIAHREKTPPPPDDGSSGTGLQHAVHDQGYRPSNTGQQRAPYVQYGSAPSTSTLTSGYGSPPPPSTSSLSGYHSQTPPASRAATSSQHLQNLPTTNSSLTSFAPPPSTVSTQDPHRHSVAAETYTPTNPTGHPQDLETPGEKFYQSLPHDRRPLQHVQPRYPGEYFQPTGSAAYPQQHQPQSGSDYNIHSAVYRPTEAEAAAHGSHRPSKQSQQRTEPGSFKGLAKRFTTGVNKTIQKAESKYL